MPRNRPAGRQGFEVREEEEEKRITRQIGGQFGNAQSLCHLMALAFTFYSMYLIYGRTSLLSWPQSLRFKKPIVDPRKSSINPTCKAFRQRTTWDKLGSLQGILVTFLDALCFPLLRKALYFLAFSHNSLEFMPLLPPHPPPPQASEFAGFVKSQGVKHFPW